MHLCTYLRVGALLHLNTVLYLLAVKPSLDFGLTWPGRACSCLALCHVAASFSWRIWFCHN
jgi:hypothetical protein